MIKSILLLTVLFFVCIPFFIFTESGMSETQVLKVGCLDFPPYYGTNNDTKELEGILIDFLKQLLDRASLKHDIIMYPPARLYANLAMGKTNIWLGTTGVDVYADKVTISPEIILNIHLRIYTVGDNPLPKSQTELNGMSLITIHGYNYAGFIEYLTDPANKITLDPSPSHQSAFQKLTLGRGEYVLDYKEPTEKTLLTIPPIPGLKFSDIMVIPIYFNINKNTPDAKDLMKKMMDTYHLLKAEGTLPF